MSQTAPPSIENYLLESINTKETFIDDYDSIIIDNDGTCNKYKLISYDGGLKFKKVDSEENINIYSSSNFKCILIKVGNDLYCLSNYEDLADFIFYYTNGNVNIRDLYY